MSYLREVAEFCKDHGCDQQYRRQLIETGVWVLFVAFVYEKREQQRKALLEHEAKLHAQFERERLEWESNSHMDIW